MILAHRKVLFSSKITDIREAGNVFHYIVIAVLQATFITAIQGILESLTRIAFIDLGMTAVLVVLLLVEYVYLEKQP